LQAAWLETSKFSFKARALPNQKQNEFRAYRIHWLKQANSKNLLYLMTIIMAIPLIIEGQTLDVIMR
jgi:hypothetical protein